MEDLMQIVHTKTCPNCGDSDFGLNSTGNKTKKIISFVCLTCHFKQEWFEEERTVYLQA